MFGIDDVIGGALISGGLQAAGNITSTLLRKPRRRRFDRGAIMRRYAEMVNRQAADEAALASQQALEIGAGNNVSGGALAQIQAQATGPIFAAAAQKIAEAGLQLQLEEEQMNAEYDADTGDWKSDLWGGAINDVASGVGAYAGYKANERYLDRVYPQGGTNLPGQQSGMSTYTPSTQTVLARPIEKAAQYRYGNPWQPAQEAEIGQFAQPNMLPTLTGPQRSVWDRPLVRRRRSPFYMGSL